MKDEEQRVVDEGLRLYNIGEYRESIDVFIKHINKRVAKKEPLPAIFFHYLGVSFYAIKDMKSAKTAFEKSVELDTKKIEYLKNLATVNYVLGLDKIALEQMLKCQKHMPDDFMIFDALGTLYYRLGDSKRGNEFGIKSLSLKDSKSLGKPQDDNWKLNFKKDDVSDKKSEKRVDVISYSLWGSRSEYLQGALKNARLSPIMYPGWQSWFYCDESVPVNVRDELSDLGAKVILMPKSLNYFGLFWRFFVANDAEVNHFIIRDVDSPLTCKERLAVEEWLSSDKPFHIMRDYNTHSELILAGMWGGVSGLLPEIRPKVESYFSLNDRERTIDQRFLREHIWPLIKEHHLAHDSIYGYKNAHPFPKCDLELDCMHVGQNWYGFENCREKFL